MSCKKPFFYKIGKIEIEADQSNKHAVRLANINTFMYWLVRLIIAAAIVYKIVAK